MPNPRLFALLSLVAVATTACGGAAASSATKDGASSESSGPVTMQKVSVGNFGNSTLTMPYTIAQEQGFFKDAGLEVETVVAPSGPALASALIGGTTQIATGVPQGVFPAMAQGQPLRAAAPYGQMDLQLVVPQSSGVKKVSDLKGKNIGVTARGAASETFARTMLKKAGVDPDSVTYVAVGPLPAQIAAFQQGSIDASSFSSDATIVAANQGVKLRDLVSTLDGSAGDLGKYGLQSFWATTEQYSKDHADVVDGFCHAMNKASDWLADDANKDAAVKSIMGVTKLPEASATQIWESQHKEFVTKIDKNRWNSNVDWILGDGGAAKVPFDKFVISDCG